MKKTFFKSSLLVSLLVVIAVSAASCKKYKKEPAEFVIGTYVGSGVDANDNPFIMKEVVVEKVSDKVVRVKPVGHSSITEFEIEITASTETQFAGENSTHSFAVGVEDSQTTIALTNTNGEQFGGTKQ